MVELPVQVERGDLGRVPLEIGEVEVIGQSLLFPWKPVHKSINRRNNESWNVSGNVQGKQGESAFSLYANNTLVFFDPTSRGKFLLFSRGNIFAPPLSRARRYANENKREDLYTQPENTGVGK